MGRTGTIVAAAGGLFTLGGGAVIAFVPEEYRPVGLAIGLAAMLVGALMFVWAFYRKEKPVPDEKTPKGPVGFRVHGHGNIVHDNTSAGYETGFDIEGDQNDVRGNEALATKKPPKEPPPEKEEG